MCTNRSLIVSVCVCDGSCCSEDQRELLLPVGRYELAREQDEDFDGPNLDALCDKLKQLATDGNRHRAKKDRRQQRSSFRDILRAIQVSAPCGPQQEASCFRANLIAKHNFDVLVPAAIIERLKLFTGTESTLDT